MVSDLNIGRNVAGWRARREMSQVTLASEMRNRGHKWSQATVWSVEKGERPLKLREASDLAEVLDTGVHYLQLDDASMSVRAELGAVMEAAAVLTDVAQRYERLGQVLRWTVADLRSSGTTIDDATSEFVEPWLGKTALDVVAGAVGPARKEAPDTR